MEHGMITISAGEYSSLVSRASALNILINLLIGKSELGIFGDELAIRGDTDLVKEIRAIYDAVGPKGETGVNPFAKRFIALKEERDKKIREAEKIVNSESCRGPVQFLDMRGGDEE